MELRDMKTPGRFFLQKICIAENLYGSVFAENLYDSVFAEKFVSCIFRRKFV